MRQNKWLTNGTALVTIVSLVIAIIIGKNSDCIGYDIAMAIFGSAGLGFIMSLIQYFAERRKGMEDFWNTSIKALSNLKRIPYIDIDAPSELVLRCFREEEENKFAKMFWGVCEELSSPIKHSAMDEMISWYEDNLVLNLTEEDYSEETLNMIYRQDMEECYKQFIRFIQTCVEVSQYDLSAMENAYGNLNFWIGNRSLRQNIYDNVYCKIKKQYDKLKQESYHFKLLNTANGRFSVCADKAVEIHKDIFDLEKNKDSDDPYDKKVYQKKFHAIEVELEQFRRKIYWKTESEEPKMIPVYATVQCVDFDTI